MLLINLEVNNQEKQNQRKFSLKITFQNAENVMVIRTDRLAISVSKL